ncbi:hypothetical protein BJ170DRAFT_693955 [Xylariales sp. AK1849]|nr:hypothetical protein BJ170DRAFT_693955 [Xylariales sp. AK1849]
MLFIQLMLAVLAAAVCAHDCPNIPTGGLRQNVTRHVAPVKGYMVVPLIWTGSVKEGGDEMHFEGSVEEVESQIRAIEPDFSWEDWTDTSVVNSDVAHSDSRGPASSSSMPLQKRDGRDPVNFICGVAGPGGYGYTSYATTDTNAEYLRHLGGDCHLQAGPQVCSRVSCSYCGGIWVCNDNDYEIHVPWGTVADYAADLGKTCHGEDTSLTAGQEFDRGGWNVIVSGVDC